MDGLNPTICILCEHVAKLLTYILERTNPSQKLEELWLCREFIYIVLQLVIKERDVVK